MNRGKMQRQQMSVMGFTKGMAPQLPAALPGALTAIITTTMAMNTICRELAMATSRFDEVDTQPLALLAYHGGKRIDAEALDQFAALIEVDLSLPLFHQL